VQRVTDAALAYLSIDELLDELLERVVADPRQNDRATLLLLAESMLADHVLDR